MKFSPGTWRPKIKAALAGATLAVAGSIALAQTGIGARALGFLNRNVDTAVVVLMVPAIALVLAMSFEAVRLTWRDRLPKAPASRSGRSLSWTPGHREG